MGKKAVGLVLSLGRKAVRSYLPIHLFGNVLIIQGNSAIKNNNNNVRLKYAATKQVMFNM